MHFRQSGLRDERRRRVLMDDVTGGGESEASETTAGETPAAPASGAPHTYDSAALDSARYRLTDLIPVRVWTLSVLTLGGLALIAGIQSLYGGVLHGDSITLPASALTALDVAAAGSLAAWFSSLLLTSAAAGSWLVYALRRHRVDDYRGTYRIWLWAGAALVWTSIDATCRCHEILRELLPQLTGTPLVGDGTAWWMMIYGVVLGGLAIRMLVEMRRCRTATSAGIMAGICYGLAASLHLGWPRLDGGVLEAMAESSLVLLGHGGVLLCVMLYARHVLLDAQGRIPPRPKRAPRPARAPKPAAQPRAKRRKGTRVDEAHATGTSGRRRRGGSDDTTDQAASDGDEDTADDRSSRTARRERPQRGSASSSNSSTAGPTNARSAARAAEDSKPTREKESSADSSSSASVSSSRTSSQASSQASSPSSSGRGDSAKPPLDVKRRSSTASRSYDDDLSDGDSADHGDDETAGLSKAERRRLRKMKRRQQA